jgi:DsbC/DsbD-like thiol-disulfide interchange protein
MDLVRGLEDLLATPRRESGFAPQFSLGPFAQRREGQPQFPTPETASSTAVMVSFGYETDVLLPLKVSLVKTRSRRYCSLM